MKDNYHIMNNVIIVSLLKATKLTTVFSNSEVYKNIEKYCWCHGMKRIDSFVWLKAMRNNQYWTN